MLSMANVPGIIFAVSTVLAFIEPIPAVVRQGAALLAVVLVLYFFQRLLETPVEGDDQALETLDCLHDERRQMDNPCLN